MYNNPAIKVLIVDDELSIREGMKTAIPWDTLHMDVIGTACNGVEALELITELNPDIVITDIRMPECSGLELIEQVSHTNFNPKFIIISGYNDFKYAQLAIKYGVHHYMLKPVNVEELMDELEQLSEQFLTEKLPSSSTTSSSIELCTQLLQNNYHSKEALYQALTTLGYYSELSLPIYVTLFETAPHSIKSLYQLLSETPYTSFVCQYTDTLLAMIIFETDTFQYEDYFNDCKSYIVKYTEQTGEVAYCSIGPQVKDITLSSDSYRTATELLTYKLYAHTSCVFDSSLLTVKPTSQFSINNNYANHISQAILSGDLEAISHYTSDFFDWLFYTPMPPPSFLKGMCIYLLIDIQKHLASHMIDPDLTFTDVPHHIIDSFTNINSIKDWILGTFQAYCFYIQNNQAAYENPIVEKALTYIQNNIRQKIYIEDVAKSVHLSVSYFTSLFKAETGQSFRNYILNKKIDEAKHLLESTDISVSNLAQFLGYDEYRSFNRAFKKITGYSPSEYQKLYTH